MTIRNVVGWTEQCDAQHGLIGDIAHWLDCPLGLTEDEVAIEDARQATPTMRELITAHLCDDKHS